jgi:hypothetical protein
MEHAADTHSGMAQLAFSQALQCLVVDLSAMAVMFISTPLSFSDIRAECGATVATTDATANTNARNIRCHRFLTGEADSEVTEASFYSYWS